jgi:hypothetical protein
VIRFSAFLVVAAVGTLVGGVVTSKLLLVYIAIGVSGLALLALGGGAAVNWRELTGKPQTAGAQASGAQADAASAPQPAPAPQPVPSRVATPEPAQAPAVPAVTGTTASRAPWSASVPAGSSRSGYLPPPEPPPATRPAGPSGWERRDAPVPPPSQPPAQEPVAPAPPAPTRSEDQGESSAPDDDVSIQDQTLIFRAQDLAPTAEPEPAASASEPTAEPEPAAEPEPEPAEPQAAEPEPATDTTPADDDSTPAGKAATAGDRESTDDATTVTEAAGPEPDLEVTVVPGVPRYHKSQCILIRFMGDSDLDKMTMAAAREAGCTPCRACLPDQSDGPSE